MMIDGSKTRTRRLRKKLRVGEFRQFGFELSFALRPGLEEREAWAFWDAFILEAIESHGLMFGGGESGFVAGEGRTSATEVHQVSVRAWLEARREVTSVLIGPLVDAWHEPLVDVGVESVDGETQVVGDDRVIAGDVGDMRCEKP